MVDLSDPQSIEQGFDFLAGLRCSTENTAPAALTTFENGSASEMVPPPPTYPDDSSAADSPPTPPAENGSAALVSPGELDADGLPWDARIHSTSRKKTVKDNKWKKLRGVDPALVVTVEAKLRGQAPTPTQIEAPESTPAPTVDFPTLMSRVQQAGLTPETVNAECQKIGVENMALIFNQPEKIGQLFAALFPNG